MMSPNVARILALPPVQWRGALSALRPADVAALACELDDVAQRAVLLAAYASHMNYANDDAGHARAVRAANVRRTKIRRALGFSYPDKGAFTW